MVESKYLQLPACPLLPGGGWAIEVRFYGKHPLDYLVSDVLLALQTHPDLFFC